MFSRVNWINVESIQLDTTPSSYGFVTEFEVYVRLRGDYMGSDKFSIVTREPRPTQQEVDEAVRVWMESSIHIEVAAAHQRSLAVLPGPQLTGGPSD